MEITDFQDVSKIKGIIFDLDGVLVDTRPLHYHCLNKALREIDPKFEITLEEHHDRYDGLSTNVKLEMLTSEKQLPRSYHRQIWRRKQEFTAEAADELIKVDEQLVATFKELKRRGYLLYCASNAIWDTIRRMLQNKGVLPYVDYFVSNEDVRFGKPNPEMYYKCLMRMGLAPCQVVILEDSPVGREAALMCGAHLIPVETPADVTLERIERGIAKVEAQARVMLSHRIVSREPVTVLLPCAGPEPADGTPKFLRDVHGLPMIKLVVENLGFRGLHVFVVREEHLAKYNLGQLLPTIASSNGTSKLVPLPSILDGAARSALAAKEHIDPERPLIVANPDQYMLWDPGNFLDTMMAKGVDGGISTFSPDPRHPRFSYCEADKDGWALRVHDDPDQPGLGTTGVYFFRRGADFIKYAEEMMAQDIRTRGLFYVHNVFNVMIKAGLKVKTLPLEEVLSTGIHDVEDFMRMKEISKMTYMGQGWRRAVKL